MRTSITIGLLVLCGFWGCSDEETTRDLNGKWIRLQDDQVVLDNDEVYVDAESGVRLRAYLINDSRCPQGVVCIWSGYAAARFELIVGENKAHTFDLATIDLLPELRRDTVVGTTKYTLIDIAPYPESGKEYKPEDYRVIISVRKNSEN